MVERDTDVAAWARRVEFSRPVRWGEVESEVLAQPAPTADQLAAIPAPPQIRWGLLAPVAAVLHASPLIALVATVLGVSAPGAATSAVWFRVAQLCLLAAFAVTASPVMIWSQTRQRGRWDLPVTAGGGLAAGAAFVVLRAAGTEDAGWTPWMALAVAVAGAAGVTVLLLASRPGRRLPRVRQRDLTPEQRWRQGVRAQVLESLIKRGHVDRREIDVPAMVDMPLGSWAQLDRPDGPRAG